MKKLISIALALTICAGFSSCGGDEPETSVSSKAESINVSSSSSSKTSSSSKVSSSSNSYSSKSESKSYYSESDSDDSFYCMGKNDTCSNKTSSAYDLYCHSCDPDDNNIEGDQSKSNGYVDDYDYDGDVDGDDWEDAWSDYLDDKYYEYGY